MRIIQLQFSQKKLLQMKLYGRSKEVWKQEVTYVQAVIFQNKVLLASTRPKYILVDDWFFIYLKVTSYAMTG